MKSILTMTIVVYALSWAASAASQNGTTGPSDKKPNIAVSGCMMRQGYGNFRLDDARVDATGDTATTAAPSPQQAGEASKNPTRWILDGAATASQHVGEKVQVVGVSDWVSRPEDYPATSADAAGPPPPMPHVDVLSLKVIASKCS